MSDLTRILEAAQRGDPSAPEALLPLVYDELRRLAASKMAQEAPGHTLQPTALVHEAWLRLGGDAQPTWANRAHFFAAAAEAMRRILVERARSKGRLKRGGNWERVSLEDVQLAVEREDAMLVSLDEALGKLAEKHPQHAELVKLRFFVGLSLPDAAQALSISETTAKRQWAFARAWLYGELAEEP